MAHFYSAMMIVLFELVAINFAYSQTVASLLTLTVNFWLNNRYTFASINSVKQRFAKLFQFIVVCNIGVFFSVSTASYINEFSDLVTTAVLLGIVVAGAWNYAVSRLFVWKNFVNRGQKNRLVCSSYLSS